MKTVLFLPNGIGLAHLGRLASIAKKLKKQKLDLVFAGGQEAFEFINNEGFKIHRLLDFTRELYERTVKKNNFFAYTNKSFSNYVKAELRLYKKVKPDLVVFDARPTVKVSAYLAKIPTVSVSNIDVTSFYDYEKISFPLQTTFGRYLPAKAVALLGKKYSQKILRPIGKRALPAMLLAAVVRVGPALIELGYRPSRDPFQFFMGDLTLICDIPEFRPMKKLPERVKLVGPIFWDGPGRLPGWKREIDGSKNIIYVSASGTGDKETFLKILLLLKGSPYTIVATTGNTLKPDEVHVRYRNLYVTDYLPGEYILNRAKLVIFPGGNASCYQALNYGIPQLCTPFHIDQEDNANQLVRLGTGVIVNPYRELNKETILEAINKILADKSYKTNVVKIRDVLKQYNGAQRAADEIKKFIL